jgi:L-ascorbate metabolism protein UlaG (beta-lactamase superfamily)
MHKLVKCLTLSLAFALCAGGALAAPIEVLWLGHATFRITSVDGKVIVIDPFLRQNPRTPPEYRDLAKLGPVDLILVTHGHLDHVGDLPELAKISNATVIVPYELGRNLATLGVLKPEKILSMNKGGASSPIGRGIKIHMVPAEHSSSLDTQTAEFPLRGTPLAALRYFDAGPAVGYVVQLENGFTIYHAGDTAAFGDMALIQRLYKPDLALVPIGGFYTMGPEEAAFALRELIKPKQVVPIHWGTYPVINTTPAELKAALGDAPIEMLDVRPGQAVTF